MTWIQRQTIHSAVLPFFKGAGNCTRMIGFSAFSRVLPYWKQLSSARDSGAFLPKVEEISCIARASWRAIQPRPLSSGAARHPARAMEEISFAFSRYAPLSRAEENCLQYGSTLLNSEKPFNSKRALMLFSKPNQATSQSSLTQFCVFDF